MFRSLKKEYDRLWQGEALSAIHIILLLLLQYYIFCLPNGVLFGSAFFHVSLLFLPKRIKCAYPIDREVEKQHLFQKKRSGE